MSNFSEQMSKLNDILNFKDSIKNHIDTIESIWKNIDNFLSDNERITVSNKIKDRVQREAKEALEDKSYWGCVFMATGSGKSKIAVDISVEVIKDVQREKRNVLIVVPTERLRDTNWMEEYVKWGYIDIWENNIERCCYASLNKYKLQDFGLVILDEGHNITENNSEFFKNNRVGSCIVLTATRPKDPIKIQILNSLLLQPTFELSLDEAVKLRLVAPYDITVINMSLDSTDKYIKAGNKAKPFMTTEKAQYGYLSTRLSAMPNQMGFISRMQFIYNLKSKTEVAKWIVNNLIPSELRTIIFCGSKEQANQLCEHRYYSKPSLPKKLLEEKKYTPKQIEKYENEVKEYHFNMSKYQGDESLELFITNKINKIACVNSLNEGHNIPKVDVGFLVQVNSNDKDLKQRMGRVLRFRPGHRGKLIILCVKDTMDKDYVAKAMVGLNIENIKYIELSDLRVGNEKILFN